MAHEWKRKDPEIVNRLNKINGLVEEIVVELAKRDANKIHTLLKMQEMLVRQKEKK